MSLKTKFLLPTIILILIGLGVITAISSISARSTLETVLERDARELAKSLTINVSNWLKSVLRDAAVWSTRQEFIDYAPTARESLDKLHTHSPLYAGISLLGMDGTVVYSTNRDNEGKLNLKERDYVKTAMAGKVGMSDINISKVSGMPVVAVAAPLLKNGEVAGAIYMTVNIPALADYFFAGVNTGDHGYMMMFNSHGGLISHPRMQEINQLESVPQYITQMLQGKEGLLFFKDEAGQEYMAAYSTDSSMGWVVAACYQMEELYKQIKQTEMINIIISVVVLLFAIVVIYMLVRSITRPLKETVEVISELAEGEGDLTVRLEVGSKDEVGYLALELNKFIGKLWDMVSLIKDHSISIDRVAQEMNSNNAEINERTQQQAGAIEETSSALEQMTGSVQNNAASARNATQKAEQTYQMAQEGGSVLNSTMTAMQEVTEASQKINAITNVVNEIAFQTNLLALNAAVEAARAGEAGKGFAVVAGEVRNLASRSASAAREIQELISDSVAKIDASNHLVRQSDDILKSIIVSIQQANDVIAGISRVSDEQSVGISEISNAVQQMDQGVQRNSQMVTDNFNLSGEMSRASHELVELLSKFKL